MVQKFIEVKIAPQRATYDVNGPPVAFRVQVWNLGQTQAQFQIQIDVATLRLDANREWYKITPESFFLKAGDRHESEIRIINTPPEALDAVQLPVIVTGMVRNAKGNLDQERKRRDIWLQIQGSRSKVIRLHLPKQDFQVYPRNPETIPVQVENLTSQNLETRINLGQIDSSWIVNGADRVLSLGPRARQEISFQIQSPALSQVASAAYPFLVQAFAREALDSQAQGTVEVLPIGLIKFAMEPTEQEIPTAGPFVWDWQAKSAPFTTQFENASNLFQYLGLKLTEKAEQDFDTQLDPEFVTLPLAEAATGGLEIIVPKRPWLGLGKTLELEARPTLSDPRQITVEPGTQTLLLKVWPLVPIWLQALILLLLSLPLLLLRPYVGHTDRVNSVHFLGDKQIFSGSEDCTIRRWDITVKDQLFRSQDTYGIKPEGQLEMELPELCRGQDNQFKTKGTLAYANDAVQAIVSFQNKQNNDFWVAAGLLDTGMIQLYNVFNNDKTCPPLKDPNSDVDRVLALVLNRNATTLYSGHGSNKIRVWQRNETGCFDLDPKIGSLSLGEQEVYEIRALALSRDDNQIVSAGSGERLLVWDDLANLDANLSGSGPSPTIAPDRQILASLDDLDPIQNIWDIAFLPDSSILATANSNGYIILWDSSKCAPFQGELFRCDDHDYWQAIKDGDASFRSVRSLKFSQDGRYLVSGGDDGRVMLWPIDPDHKLERIEGIPSKGQVIFEGNQPISSVDLLETNAGLFIASGSQDHRVRLHHEVLEKSEEEEDVSTPTTVPNLPESGVIDLNNLDPNNPQAIPTNPP